MKLQELITGTVEDNTELWVFKYIITVIIIDARELVKVGTQI